MALTQVSPGLLNAEAQAQGFRNRIINGDMRIAQRGTAAVTTDSSFPVDRFLIGHSTDGAFSAQQDSSAPVGFVNSLKVTTTTADASLTGTQNLQLIQRIEGTNVSDLGFGTANAKTVTLSFWVRSSLTGTFGGSLKNSANDRSYPFNYTISSADTWEQKSITIPGDTSGTWLTTTGVGINVNFGLGVGPDRSGTADAWATINAIAPTGAVSVIGTLNATWYITGVQLEVGSVATEFERRPYGTELQLCMRYYQTLDNVQIYVSPNYSSWGYFNYQFPVQMRATPTSGQTAVISVDLKGSYTKTQSNISISNETVNNIAGTFNLGAFTSLSLGTINQQSSGGKVTLSSEL